MCGIVGYIGSREALPIVLEGLHRLEYRGYDSAGIASIDKGELFVHKEVGKVAQLEKGVERKGWKSHLAIGHTRWATHGVPSRKNAHPHVDEKRRCAVVHNGIIENYDAIRRLLEKRGVAFQTDTDSETIAQLIGFLYKGNFLRAVQRALPLLQGAFAIAVVHHEQPGEIICAAQGSPLAIGMGQEEMFLASDAAAFLKYTRRAIYLRDSEVAQITQHGVEVFGADLTPIEKESEDLTHATEEVTKGDFQHFMLKEIHEQPQSIQNALLARFSKEYGTATLDNLNFSDQELQQVERIVILACGTSYHAGLIAGQMIEEYARIPVQVEISSEYRYKNPIVWGHTLALAISQSGETADTLAAMRELHEKGAKIMGLCNVQGSTMAREVDSSLFLRAGPEIGVAATKSFTSQLVVLSLLALKFARMRQMSAQEGIHLIEALEKLPQQVQQVILEKNQIAELAKKYAGAEHFFFLGRRYMFATALEGALKLKEIAYVNANGYAAGEMKHGPIALIHKASVTVAFCSDSFTYPKMISNLMEIKARAGRILAIAPEGAPDIESIADDVIWVPPTLDALAPVASSVAAQLLSYFIAFERGTEIDQPRNLAKSVTVE